jgi:regulator of nucleoside diphosphate kinase
MGAIAITLFDFRRLHRLLFRLRTRGHLPLATEFLADELDRADIIEPQRDPADIVTMGSVAVVRDLATDEVERIRLVFPGADAPGRGAVSVLAPLGLALLGTRAGDEVSWGITSPTRRLRVEGVTCQPRATGRCDR